MATSINISLYLEVADKYIWEKSEMRSEKLYMIYITSNCICNDLRLYYTNDCRLVFLVM